MLYPQNGRGNFVSFLLLYYYTLAKKAIILPVRALIFPKKACMARSPVRNIYVHTV